MDAIQVLRQRAADKQDKLIKDAGHEYQQACKLLDMLDGLIEPEPPPKRRECL